MVPPIRREEKGGSILSPLGGGQRGLKTQKVYHSLSTNPSLLSTNPPTPFHKGGENSTSLSLLTKEG